MRTHNASFFVLLAALSIGCDHATKQLATLTLEPGAAHALWGNLVRFERVQNPGAFMSLGASLAPGVREALLVYGVPLLLAAVCIWIVRSGPLTRREWTGLALLAGGGAGNWLDRLLHDGSVTDFVSVGVGALRTGIFNLADVVIILGLLLLALPGGLARARPRTN